MYDTLKSPGDIDRIFGAGRRWVGRGIIVLYIDTPEGRGQDGRVVFVAGKRLGGAVYRNRAKRVLREAVRRRGKAWPGLDVALVARRDTGSASPAELDRALSGFSGRVGVRGAT